MVKIASFMLCVFCHSLEQSKISKEANCRTGKYICKSRHGLIFRIYKQHLKLYKKKKKKATKLKMGKGFEIDISPVKWPINITNN